MKVYKGASASPGLVLGQVSRLERHVETFSDGPFNPEREQRMLDEAIHTAQTELDSMAERSAPTEQAIFLFQSMMLEDEGMMNEVRFQIKAGVGAAEAMDRVGRRYAERLANMKDNAYMQLRSVDILDATKGECILDPDAAARQQAVTRICELQRENEELSALRALPNRTRDGAAFELLANCFGPEDIDTAMQSGACGVGLLRSSYMMLPGRILDEQEQYFFYTSCLAAANGCLVTVRTFDFGADRTMADAYQGLQSSKLGLRGIRNSLRNPRQFETQICALMRAAARGPLRVMFPMVTDVEDWDAAMEVVERCRQRLRERGVSFNEDTSFGVMLSVPSACLTAEEFVAHGCGFFVIGTNDLTQYTHAVDRELAPAEHYYRPASKAMKKLIRMVMDAAKQGNVPVTICGLAVGNPANATQYLQLGLRSFSMSPQNLLEAKKALLEADALPEEEELE